MLVKILGLIDFISGLILIFGAGINLPTILLGIFGTILLLKSFCFGWLTSIASWIDFIAGITLILSMLFLLPSVICIIAGILVIQKGIFSFL